MDFIVVMGLVPVTPRPPASGRTTVVRGEMKLPAIPHDKREDRHFPSVPRQRPAPEAPYRPVAPSTDLLGRWEERF